MPDKNPIPAKAPKTLRKTAQIPEKEAPAPENVIAEANKDVGMSNDENVVADSDTPEVESEKVRTESDKILEELEEDKRQCEAQFHFIQTGNETEVTTSVVEPDEFDEDDIDIEPIL